MGLFGSFKKAFNHGGIKLAINAPTTIAKSDLSLPVQVTVSATDQAQTINRVSAEIIATDRNQSFNNNSSLNQPNQMERTVARIDNTEVFSLTPGESRSVQLTLTMNGGLEAIAQLAGINPNSMGGKLAETLIGAMGNANASSYSYTLRVSADVAGVKLDPAKDQPLQILAAGSIGTSLNVQL